MNKRKTAVSASAVPPAEADGGFTAGGNNSPSVNTATADSIPVGSSTLLDEEKREKSKDAHYTLQQLTADVSAFVAEATQLRAAERDAITDLTHKNVKLNEFVAENNGLIVRIQTFFNPSSVIHDPVKHAEILAVRKEAHGKLNGHGTFRKFTVGVADIDDRYLRKIQKSLVENADGTFRLPTAAEAAAAKTEASRLIREKREAEAAAVPADAFGGTLSSEIADRITKSVYSPAQQADIAERIASDMQYLADGLKREFAAAAAA